MQFQVSFSQQNDNLNYFLDEISQLENSKEILNDKNSQIIIQKGIEMLMPLSDTFTDFTITSVKSECQDKFLTKGEISIILADHILKMSYFLVTGIRNCLMTFCEDNPNLIEYYLDAIDRKGVSKFKEDYQKWLKKTKAFKEYKKKN